MKMKTWAVNCNDAWPNTEGDDISGSYVKYKDHQEVVAALEAKCEALAAENAGLKTAAKETLAHWAAAEPGEMEQMMDRCMPSLRFSYCETPATDAFLAEVRAQGVEMFVKHNHEWAKHYEKHGVRDGSVDRRIGIAYEAEQFAAQLRQEAAQ